MKKITKRQKEILDLMPPVKGEVRAVYKCKGCNKLFGHRFIPFGLGRGLLVNICLCQITSRVDYKEVARMEP